MGKRELIALLSLSSWCLVMVGRLFLTVPRGCLQFVIVVFPDHTHLLFLINTTKCMRNIMYCDDELVMVKSKYFFYSVLLVHLKNLNRKS